MLETAAIILLVILDQAVKYLVKTNIPLGGSVPFLPGILGLTHIHNEGAAFSMLTAPDETNRFSKRNALRGCHLSSREER